MEYSKYSKRTNKQKSKEMKNEYLINIKEEDIKVGVILYKKGGRYKEKPALYIPGHDWVPCAKRLVDDMTTDPKELVIVHMEEDDEETSWSKWVSRATTRILSCNMKISELLLGRLLC